MPYIEMTVALFGLAVGFASILSQVYFWQRKEYRLDRMRSFWLSPEASLEKMPWLLAAITIIGIGWLLLLFGAGVPAGLAGTFALLAFAIHHSQRIRIQGLLRPGWTFKARLITAAIIALSAIYIATFIWQPNAANGASTPLLWGTLIFLMPAIAAGAVGFINIITYPRKRHIIEQAQVLRTRTKSVTVIGITGSYGKTSTKFFLQQLLKNTGKTVAATGEHRNSELPVAQDMLRQLPRKPDIYITEMGAYRRGEIKALADLAQPSIGIITGIGNQHIDLFGSQADILAAKWELVESLPQSGTAILNSDDSLLKSRANKGMGHMKTIWFSSQHKADVYAQKISILPDRIRCRLHIGGQSKSVTIPLASDALLNNLLAAVTAAHHLGVSSQSIFTKVQHLEAFERTMEIRRGHKDAVTIDDSYSTGEAAALNAIQHIGRFQSPDKRVVIVPLIELGKDAPAAHRKIAAALKKSSATIYIYGTAHKDDLQQGFNGYDKVTWFTDPEQLRQAVNKDITSQSAVLLEGRIPGIVRTSLLKSNP